MDRLGAAAGDLAVLILSPTQIETFDPETVWGCNLKWWWSYVMGKRGVQDASMALGEAVHGTIETYLGGGAAGVLHDIALPGAAFLERIRPKVRLIEKKIEPGELELAGVPVIGRIDALADSEIADVNLIDWKTTSNIARYAKTPGQLAESVQMMVYSAWLLQFDVNSIELTHGYFQTKGKKFEPVNKLVDKKHVEKRIEIISSTIELMKVAGDAKTPDQVAPDTRKCRIGFGCPHRAYCPHAGEFNMASLLDAFKKSSPGGVAEAQLVSPVSAPILTRITPPDQPKSDPKLAADPPKVEVTPKRENMQIIDVPPPPPTPPIAPPPELLQELPKKGPGRPKGSTNKPKDLGATPAALALSAPVVAASAPTATAEALKAEPAKVTRITVRHGAKIGQPNYSSATVEVEYEALVTGNVEAARESVSMACRAAMMKELEVYTKPPTK
jgi:hypothetical protein